MNENEYGDCVKDKQRSYKLACDHSSSAAQANRLASGIDDLLTTVRQEEREAAFKVLCIDCAEGDVPILDKQARWYYHGEDSKTLGCSASKLRMKAASKG